MFDMDDYILVNKFNYEQVAKKVVSVLAEEKLKVFEGVVVLDEARKLLDCMEIASIEQETK